MQAPLVRGRGRGEAAMSCLSRRCWPDGTAPWHSAPHREHAARPPALQCCTAPHRGPGAGVHKQTGRRRSAVQSWSEHLASALRASAPDPTVWLVCLRGLQTSDLMPGTPPCPRRWRRLLMHADSAARPARLAMGDDRLLSATRRPLLAMRPRASRAREGVEEEGCE
jgi:hypothetical protein